MRKEIQGRNGTNRPQSYRTSDVAVTSIDSTNGVAENWIKTKKNIKNIIISMLYRTDIAPKEIVSGFNLA
jgi:hypothetical protein